MLGLRKLGKTDYILSLLIVPIGVIGLLNVFSTTYFPDQKPSGDFIQQILFFIIGIGLYLFVSAINSRWLKVFKFQLALLVINLAVLTSLIFLGSDIGPSRWLQIGAFSIQPSEFAKLLIIINTAFAFSKVEDIEISKIGSTRSISSGNSIISNLSNFVSNPYGKRILFNLISVVLTLLLILIQPSLGNTIIAFSIWALTIASLAKSPTQLIIYQVVGVLGFASTSLAETSIQIICIGAALIISYLSLRFLKLNVLIALTLLIIGIVSGLSTNLVWNHVLTGYQQDRIVGFLQPESSPLGDGWQVRQAKVAIASGRIFGKGYLQGTQTNSGLLPYAYTDFAYAAYSEQFGWVGGSLLITLYLALIWRILAIGHMNQDNFARMLCIGVASMLLVNIVINVGMNLGLMPVTGVPLPLVSYGGSAVLVNFIGLGLVQMVHSERSDEVEATKIYDLAEIHNG